MSGVPPSTSIHRQCRVLAGGREWAWRAVEAWLSEAPELPVLWLARRGPPGRAVTPPGRREVILGSECAVLVFDAHEGLHPDHLAAALGTLRGGGLLCLLTPAEDWPDHLPGLERLAPWPMGGDAVGRRLLWRMQRSLAMLPETRCLTPGAPLDWPRHPALASPGWSLNAQQQELAEAVVQTALAPSGRPLVVTADRGRGKSTALGHGLAGVLRQGRTVLLCAPSRAAVGSLWAQLRRVCPQVERMGDDYALGRGRLLFVTPQALLEGGQTADLLVLDEAAALGLGTLKRVTGRYPRLVFSTTVHGYEGSGRGFVARFLGWLGQRFSDVRHMTLNQPVRWSPDDPLEAWLNGALLLDAESDDGLPPASPRLEWLDQARLAGDEALLRQVFALLVSAHYQTRPSDLQQLLDAPGLRILVAMRGASVLGVLVAVEEGGFPRDLAEAVCAGRRRPRGHLLLQSLAQHAGWCQAPRLRALRVMRIAVRADMRRQGLGSEMLQALSRVGRQEGLDLLGTAFGLEAGVLAFWLSQGYRAARVGQRVDPASGAHSGLLLKGLSAAGRNLAAEAERSFTRDLPLRLARELSSLPGDVAERLLDAADGVPDESADARDCVVLRAFAQGCRRFADAWPSLRRCLLAAGGVSDDRTLARWLLRPAGQPLPERDVERDLRLAARDLLGRLTYAGGAPTLRQK